MTSKEELEALREEVAALLKDREHEEAAHRQAIAEADRYEQDYQYLRSLLGVIYYIREEAPTTPVQVLDGYKRWMERALESGKSGGKQFTQRERDLLLLTVEAVEDIVAGRFTDDD